MDATEYISEILARKFEVAQLRDGESEKFFRKWTLKGTWYRNKKGQSLCLPINTYGAFYQAVRVFKIAFSSVVVIVGPPGFRKSFGLRLQLWIWVRKRRTDVLEYEKKRIRYMVVPYTSGKWATCSLRSFESSMCELPKHNKNFYVSDSSISGLPLIYRAPVKTIMAASLDLSHYQEFITKQHEEKLGFVPYETNELIAMYRLRIEKGLRKASGGDEDEK